MMSKELNEEPNDQSQSPNSHDKNNVRGPVNIDQVKAHPNGSMT